MKYPLRPETLATTYLIDPHVSRSLASEWGYEDAVIRDMKCALGNAAVERAAILSKQRRLDLRGAPFELTLKMELVPGDEALRFHRRSETMASRRWYVRWLSAAADHLWGWALKLEGRSITR